MDAGRMGPAGTSVVLCWGMPNPLPWIATLLLLSAACGDDASSPEPGGPDLSGALFEPDHVVESITGHLSRRMLEHYSHIRINAKKAALDRLGQPTNVGQIKVKK